jgi:hypothetical protein
MQNARQIFVAIVELMATALISILADRLLSTKAAFIALAACLTIICWHHWSGLKLGGTELLTLARNERAAAISFLAVVGLVLGAYAGYWLTKPRPVPATAVQETKPTPQLSTEPIPGIKTIAPAKVMAKNTKPSHTGVLPVPSAKTQPPAAPAGPVGVYNAEGGKFYSTCSEIDAPGGRAIENHGEMALEHSSVNAPPPCSPSEKKAFGIDQMLSASLRQNNFVEHTWSVWCEAILRKEFDEQTAKGFMAQPDTEKKREFLRKLKEPIHP